MTESEAQMLAHEIIDRLGLRAEVLDLSDMGGLAVVIDVLLSRIEALETRADALVRVNRSRFEVATL